MSKIEILKESCSTFPVVMSIIAFVFACFISLLSLPYGYFKWWDLPAITLLYFIVIIIHEYFIGLEDPPVFFNEDLPFFGTFILLFIYVGNIGGVFFILILNPSEANSKIKGVDIILFVITSLQLLLTLYYIWREYKHKSTEKKSVEEPVVEKTPLFRMSDDGRSVLWYRGGVTSCVIPDGVEIIDKEVFYGHKELESIIIPDSVKEIGPGAFQGCGLRAIILPNSISRIEARTFACCRQLKEISFPNSLETICIEAFNQCVSLECLEIPSAVNEIEGYAISQCEKLKEVIIKSKAINIHNDAFTECKELLYVEIPFPMFLDRAFYRCSKNFHIVVQNNGKGKLI